MDLAAEQEGLDEALALLAATRAELISIATALALGICREAGEVTSTVVWEGLERFAKLDPTFAAKLDSVDPRWMGVVFRSNRGWKRVRWENLGSHMRPVAVWTR